MSLQQEFRDIGKFVFRSRLGAISGIVMVAALVIGLVIEARTKPRAFDARVWRERPAQRHRMVSDLIGKGTLKGMVVKDVLRLLGNADSKQIDPVDAHDHLVYWIATAGIDDLWLDLEIADSRVANARVADARVYSD